MTKWKNLTYFAITALLALLSGIYLLANNGANIHFLVFLDSGVVFVQFLTWPLKYLTLGAMAAFLVWGPLLGAGILPWLTTGIDTL